MSQVKGRTVWAVLESTVAKYPDHVALQQPIGDGKYRAWTWREYADTVREVAVALHAHVVFHAHGLDNRIGEAVGDFALRPVFIAHVG